MKNCLRKNRHFQIMLVFLYWVLTWLKVLKTMKNNYFYWFLLRTLIQRLKLSLYNTYFYLWMSFKYCIRCELTSHFSIMFSDRSYYVFHTKSSNIDQPSFIFLSYTIFTRGLKKQRNTSKLSNQSHFQKVNIFGYNWTFL